MPSITIEATIPASMDVIWRAWTTPADICRWNAASDDWHTPRATVDLRVGGRFLSRMEAKDGSFGFDFEGTYEIVDHHRRIAYVMDDGRRADTTFTPTPQGIQIKTVFDAETMHTIEEQRSGWQAILDRFGRYVTTDVA